MLSLLSSCVVNNENVHARRSCHRTSKDNQYGVCHELFNTLLHEDVYSSIAKVGRIIRID